MQLFVRNGQTLCLNAEQSDTVLSLKTQVFQRQGVPEAEQRLVYGGKQLRDGDSLQTAGLEQDATIHLVLRLLGGKGGFGALLRAGARSSVGENTDAYRDLSGRRLRHVNADKKLSDWAAQARERELEKIAFKHIKEQAKAEARQARAEVDVDAVRVEHQQNMRHVKGAIDDALAGLPHGIKRDLDTTDSTDAAAVSAKRARIFGDSGSDSEDSEDEEPAVAAATAGAQPDAAATAGPSSSGSAAAVPTGSGSPPAASSPAGGLPTGAPESSSGGSPAAEPNQQAAAASDHHIREPSAASDVSSASAEATLTTSAEASLPADAAAAAFVPAPAVTVVREELDLEQYEDAAALEAVGLEVLKAHLMARGLKRGGSLSQRAERLFLLKHTPLEQLDRKHLAKPARA